MGRHTVLIISEQNTDHLILSACLERALPERFKVARSKQIDRPLEALLDPSIDAVIMAHGPESEYLLRLAHKNGATIPILVLIDEATEQLTGQLQDFGAQDYLVRGQLQDGLVHRILDYSIQLKSAREQIRQLSNRDTLTGTLNRSGFRAHLERAIDRSQRYDFKTALLHINIDQFANINDHYGETNGDQMIQTLSQRLLNKLRSTDSLARIGGDEFTVILEDINSAADAELIAGKMLASISEPMTLNDQRVSVDASIGAAVFPESSLELAELLEQARAAMLQAKALPGGQYALFSEELQFDVAGNNTLAADLRSAVRKNQFELHYQPRVNLTSGELDGLEALLRWNHPERGLLLPAEFIDTCEDMGLLRTIGYQVIQHACSAQAWMREQGMDDVDVAVNVSFSQIQDEHFVSIVTDIIERTGANPGRLELELTETTILKSPGEIKSRMDELRLLGVSFSLDDFGTGFSQLSHLTELPISAIKIDRSFVSDLPHNEQQVAICTMVIKMAQKLGMPVVAEGAETYEQVNFLREQECDQVQGFYYSQAIPLQQLPRFVQEQRFKQREQIRS